MERLPLDWSSCRRRRRPLSPSPSPPVPPFCFPPHIVLWMCHRRHRHDHQQHLHFFASPLVRRFNIFVNGGSPPLSPWLSAPTGAPRRSKMAFSVFFSRRVSWSGFLPGYRESQSPPNAEDWIDAAMVLVRIVSVGNGDDGRGFQQRHQQDEEQRRPRVTLNHISLASLPSRGEQGEGGRQLNLCRAACLLARRYMACRRAGKRHVYSSIIFLL